MLRRSIRIFTGLLVPCLLAALLLSPMETSAVPVTSQVALPVSVTNWGLSFPTEGESPVGLSSIAAEKRTQDVEADRPWAASC